jgi:DNA-binding transcriptional LysR family regulator
VSLFRRTPQGMRLSPAGALFRAHARGILQGVREAKDAMRGTTRGDR